MKANSDDFKALVNSYLHDDVELATKYTGELRELLNNNPGLPVFPRVAPDVAEQEPMVRLYDGSLAGAEVTKVTLYDHKYWFEDEIEELTAHIAKKGTMGIRVDEAPSNIAEYFNVDELPVRLGEDADFSAFNILEWVPCIAVYVTV